MILTGPAVNLNYEAVCRAISALEAAERELRVQALQRYLDEVNIAAWDWEGGRPWA